jgi:glycosyltransferase involved in cell wall biosynthesis
LGTGGAERALYNVLSGGLAESGDSAVLSLGGEGAYGAHIRALGVRVYTLGMRRAIPSPAVIWRIRQLVKEFRPQIVQGWMYHGNLAASLAAYISPAPQPAVAWNIRHSLYSLKAEKSLTQLVIRANRRSSTGVGAILYNSCLSRKQHEEFGFSSRQGIVIPNGFDTVKLKPGFERGKSVRRSLCIPDQAIVVGHVARFHAMKDHPAFLRAAVEVMRKRDDVICLLVGKDVHLSNPKLSRILPLELENRFWFVGERDDVPDLMQAMDIFCQSSWSEAFPNVLGEAMSLGVPCVATDVGDSRYIIGETGKLVPASDIDSLAKGLTELLNLSSDQRAALGRASRRRIENNFSLPTVVDRYRKLYESLLLKN